MPFGVDTITLVALEKTGVPDSLGNYPLVEKLTKAPGCRHRPLTFTETAELEFDIGTELWKSTFPLTEFSTSVRSKVMAAKVNDVIRVDGDDYQIVGGIRVFKDETGPFKATIVSKKHIG